jgi:hypothetical protein
MRKRVFARGINYVPDTAQHDFVSELARNKLLRLGRLKPELVTVYAR